MAESTAPLIHPSRIINRWAQLVAGIIAMMAIANLQYAWTLFTKPMQSHLKVSLTAIQINLTGLGQGQGAGGPFNQSNSQPRLESGNGAADARFGVQGPGQRPACR